MREHTPSTSRPRAISFGWFRRTPSVTTRPLPSAARAFVKIALDCKYKRSLYTALSFWTVAQAFFHKTRLGLVEPPAKVSGDEWVFVYGGSCTYCRCKYSNTYGRPAYQTTCHPAAVGFFAIQLAHLAGYKVATTASPRNFDLVRSLGADAVFDYRDPDVVAEIKQVTGGSLTRALDAISDRASQRISAEVLAPTGGKVVLVSGPEPGATDRTDVEFIRASPLPCIATQGWLTTFVLSRSHLHCARSRI